MIKTGISGLRGTVVAGETSLTATTAAEWVQAYVGEVKVRRNESRPKIALGHDARRSSPALAAVAKGALLLAGADVIELGLTMTPTVQFTIRHDDEVDGGLMITASHNPIIYNGLKFLDHQGFFMPVDWWEAMETRVQRHDLPAVSLDHVGCTESWEKSSWQAHLHRTLGAIPVDLIRQRKYRVALDACNGGAARWAELLLACGCEPVLLHTEQHGFFAREAEPLPEHLGALQDLVRSAHCDLGLAADPDGDRLVLVDANGNTVSEEHTVVLVAMALAETEDDVVVVNAVTTHAIDRAIPARVIRTAVGEMNVVNGVLQHHAILGGEGSGGIIIPRINLARDGMAAAATILTLMAREKATLAELIEEIPVWEAVKSKLTSTDSPATLRSLMNAWQATLPLMSLQNNALEVTSSAGALRLEVEEDGQIVLHAVTVIGSSFTARGQSDDVARLFAALEGRGISLDMTDGVKVLGESAWLSLRPSNTEPIVRLMGEIGIEETVERIEAVWEQGELGTGYVE